MPFRSSIRSVQVAAVLAAVTLTAIPAQAQSSPPPPPMVDAGGRSYDGAPAMIPAPLPPMGAQQMPYPAQPQFDQASWERARADWLDECRYNHRRDSRGKTVGGALIGGVLGGIAGNVIAGRGDKTLGTVAGAAVGAVAGGAIGNSADRRQDRRAMDYCEAYLERYTNYGYGRPGYGTGYTYAYQPMTVMVPVMMVPVQAVATAKPAPRECTETQVIEEWVPVGGSKRYIPPRKRVPDKRIPI